MWDCQWRWHIAVKCQRQCHYGATYKQRKCIIRVCLLHNNVFYIILTHEFFCTIRLRSNSLHLFSTSSLLLPSDNHNIIDLHITDHISQKIIFFYGRTNHRAVGSIACPFVMGRRVVGPLAGRDFPCSEEAVEAQKSLRTVEA